jgi:hypothetical protein
LLIAARVLGYGKDYTIKINFGEERSHTIDLAELEDKELNSEHLT